jgi:large subunit ribosomal protein L19
MSNPSYVECKANPNVPELSPGDTIKVHSRIVEGDKERVQVFQGVIIKINHGGAGANYTVRRVSHDVGVERTFPFYSPLVEKVEVVRHGKVRRARLYYLRGLSAKKSRIKERRVIDKLETPVTAELPTEELPAEELVEEAPAVAETAAPEAEAVVEEAPVVAETSAPEAEAVVEEAPVVAETAAPEAEAVVEEAPVVAETSAPEAEAVVEETPVVAETSAPEAEAVVEEAPAVTETSAPEAEAVVEEAPVVVETETETKAEEKSEAEAPETKAKEE